MIKDDIAYLTPKQVAGLLMVSVAAVRQWAEKGDLKALITPGGHRRYLKEDVMAFAKEKKLRLSDFRKELTKVLIVDDDAKFSEYLEKMLSRYPDQLVVELAGSGFDAGVMVGEFKPDIVLLDLMMEDIDGFYVCHKIKSDSAGDRVRVIAMTGFPSKENVSSILEAGAEICLRKPFKQEELLDLIGVVQVVPEQEKRDVGS